MQPTYVVGGYQRCGTSMMMKALHAGGLEAARSTARDEAMNEKSGDENFVPNEEYYELSPEDYRSEKFPWPYEGKLIKILQSGILGLPPGNWKVVYMMRSADEIIESYRAAFGSNPPATKDGWHCWENLVGTLQKATLRRDMDVVPVWYDGVLVAPNRVFERLYNEGWPIDMKAASEAVKPELKRFDRFKSVQ